MGYYYCMSVFSWSWRGIMFSQYLREIAREYAVCKCGKYRSVSVFVWLIWDAFMLSPQTLRSTSWQDNSCGSCLGLVQLFFAVFLSRTCGNWRLDGRFFCPDLVFLLHWLLVLASTGQNPSSLVRTLARFVSDLDLSSFWWYIEYVSKTFWWY